MNETTKYCEKKSLWKKNCYTFLKRFSNCCNPLPTPELHKTESGELEKSLSETAATKHKNNGCGSHSTVRKTSILSFTTLKEVMRDDHPFSNGGEGLFYRMMFA